jgi:hypothetical protein
MPQARFEPTISADERPQTHTLDRVATGIDIEYFSKLKFLVGILVTGNLNSYDETRDNKLQQV